jgi:tetratricopeptide (TPR) repeat protein
VARVPLLTLTGEEDKRLSKRYTQNVEAYRHFIRGRFLWNKRKEEDLLKAITHFQQAVDLDSDYALAYSGLADSYFLLPDYSNTPAREAYPKAKMAAINALRIDDSLAEAHTSLGQVREYYDWAWSDAESEYKRAISLNPNYVTAYHWYGFYLTRTARFEEGISELKKVQELDPLSQMINADVAWGLLWFIQSGQVDGEKNISY